MFDTFHRRFFSRFLYVLVPWVTFVGQSGSTLKDHDKLSVELRQGTTRIAFQAEVVRSLEARSYGLSHRSKPLGKKEAMLFFFSPPEHVGFWMRDTLIPLEVAYFDAAGKLNQTYNMPVEQNPAYPARVYSSKGLTQVALEVAPHSLDVLDTAKPTELWAEKIR